MTAQTEQLMTTAQLAAYLNVSIRTVEDWRYRGDSGPPHRKVGGQARYLPADVTRWLRKNKEGIR